MWHNDSDVTQPLLRWTWHDYFSDERDTTTSQMNVTRPLLRWMWHDHSSDGVTRPLLRWTWHDYFSDERDTTTSQMNVTRPLLKWTWHDHSLHMQGSVKLSIVINHQRFRVTLLMIEKISIYFKFSCPGINFSFKCFQERSHILWWTSWINT